MKLGIATTKFKKAGEKVFKINGDILDVLLIISASDEVPRSKPGRRGCVYLHAADDRYQTKDALVALNIEFWQKRAGMEVCAVI